MGISIAALEEKLVEGGEGVYEKCIFGDMSFVIMCYELGEWRIWGNVHNINGPRNNDDHHVKLRSQI